MELDYLSFIGIFQLHHFTSFQREDSFLTQRFEQFLNFTSLSYKLGSFQGCYHNSDLKESLTLLIKLLTNELLLLETQRPRFSHFLSETPF